MTDLSKIRDLIGRSREFAERLDAPGALALTEAVGLLVDHIEGDPVDTGEFAAIVRWLRSYKPSGDPKRQDLIWLRRVYAVVADQLECGEHKRARPAYPEPNVPREIASGKHGNGHRLPVDVTGRLATWLKAHRERHDKLDDGLRTELEALVAHAYALGREAGRSER